MGIHHLQAQLLIAHWLRKRYSRSVVTLEETTEDGRNRADVMITAPDGTQVAFEVQYSPISIPEWTKRHERYKAAGITDVWLWGHTNPHLQNHSENEVALSLLLEHVRRETGRPLLSVNPSEAAIATAWTAEAVRSRSYTVSAHHKRGHLALIPFGTLDLRRHGLSSPFLEELVGEDVAWRTDSERQRLRGLIHTKMRDNFYVRSQAVFERPTTEAFPPRTDGKPVCAGCGQPLADIWVSNSHSSCLAKLRR